MPSAKRILGALAVLAVVGYIGIEATKFWGMSKSQEQANAFCSKVKPGSSVDATIALARADTTKRLLSESPNEIVMLFSGGCHCRISFNDGKAFPGRAMCNA